MIIEASLLTSFFIQFFFILLLNTVLQDVVHILTRDLANIFWRVGRLLMIRNRTYPGMLIDLAIVYRDTYLLSFGFWWRILLLRFHDLSRGVVFAFVLSPTGHSSRQNWGCLWCTFNCVCIWEGEGCSVKTQYLAPHRRLSLPVLVYRTTYGSHQ